MFKRLVNAIEFVALGVALVLVVLLLVYRPATPGAPKAVAARGAAAKDDVGATLFASNCAGCHGARGQGGLGPKLAGGAVVASFPDESAELALVANGKGVMPAWKTRLSPDQIRAVVAYTRNSL